MAMPYIKSPNVNPDMNMGITPSRSRPKTPRPSFNDPNTPVTGGTNVGARPPRPPRTTPWPGRVPAMQKKHFSGNGNYGSWRTNRGSRGA